MHFQLLVLTNEALRKQKAIVADCHALLDSVNFLNQTASIPAYLGTLF